MNFEEIKNRLTEARNHMISIGDGRAAEIMDAALQEWTGGDIRWRHVDAIESKARECECYEIVEFESG